MAVELDENQLEVARHLTGGLLVMAPVGTGKTLVLAERMAYAIASRIPPERILGLTFTNRACNEMRERVKKRYPQFASSVRIQTFHGLCATMLRTEARYIGLPCDFVIYDEADCQEVIKELGGDPGEVRNMLAAIQGAKVDAPLELISASDLWSLERLFRRKCPDLAGLAVRYQDVLRTRHALDFADLVLMVRVTLNAHPDVRKRWENRYDLVQVDEVQDTHLSEYEVVRYLARRSGNLALVGDMNQTIYEWRGSRPGELLTKFFEDFKPVTTMSLEINYRATRVLVQAANAVASRLRRYVSGVAQGTEGHRETAAASSTAVSPQAGAARSAPRVRACRPCRPSAAAEKGERIGIRRFDNEHKEADWVCSAIRTIVDTRSVRYNQIGVLTRTNGRGEDISKVFARENLPHVTVEQFQFFAREEIKDALACLKMLINPRDKASVTRVLLKLARGVGDSTIKDINVRSQGTGLSLSDLIMSSSFIHGDPFYRLIQAWDSGGIVVLDVETTDIYADAVEVIEIAAARVVRGKVTGTFRALLRNTVPVGASEIIHHYSDDMLREAGEEAADVFRRFFRFAADSGGMLAGHNAQAFDVPVIESHARRLGLSPPGWVCYDTLDLAQRFITSPGYSLGVLAQTLGLEHEPTHKALDDVLCTCDLLRELMPLITKGASDRQTVVLRHSQYLEPFARLVDGWRAKARTERPPDLLDEILETSGIRRRYAKERNRLDNLDTLCHFFRVKDEHDLEPWDALQHLTKMCAISTNVDLIADDDNRVPVITVHQAKGLEFDYVFLVSATADQFPSYLAVRDGKFDEEARVFYVAVTRARKQLFISYPTRLGGYWKKPSPFLEYFDPECVST
ncbi:MAG: 3'-5' exonuclease [Bacillota bacterium]|nr:3'-5' exonuclease [Bacillota bacterium]